MEGSDLFKDQDLNSLTQEQRNKIREYQKIHTRLRVLKAQMSEIQEETHELLETLEHLRLKDNKQNESDGKE